MSDPEEVEAEVDRIIAAAMEEEGEEGESRVEFRPCIVRGPRREEPS